MSESELVIPEERLQMNLVSRIACQRIGHGNRDCNILVVGPTGSGKSYQMLRGSYEIMKYHGLDFKVRACIAFSIKDLVQKTMDWQQVGVSFGFDEAGVRGAGGMNREWQSSVNKDFSTYVQTKRFQRQAMWITLPNSGFLDNQVRSLIHYKLNMKFVNPSSKLSFSIPYCFQWNDNMKKLYIKKLRVANRLGTRQRVDKVAFKLPPSQVIYDYELAKKEYVKVLQEEMSKKQVVVERSGRPEPKVTKEKIETLWQGGKGGRTWSDIARELGTSYMYVHTRAKDFGII